jgi:hypothetical protein
MATFPWKCLAFAAALGAGACERDTPKEPVSQYMPPERPAVSAADRSYYFPAAPRLVAIGDLHGDLDAAVAALRIAGAVDKDGNWAGGKLVVVQTGDVLDRGDEEREILELLDHLTVQAKEAGGALHLLNGNHEVMNVAGDFRYVTSGGFSDYRDVKPGGGLMTARVNTFPPLQRGRAAAFLPGGPVAKRLSEHPVAIVVGDTAFAHGGILPGHARQGLTRINSETKEWMAGKTARAPIILEGPASPIWTRDYSEGDPDSRVCEALTRALEQLSARRMVVGHTPQKGGITSACDKRVWRIDVGMAKAYGGKASVLEIKGNQVRVLTSPVKVRPAHPPGQLEIDPKPKPGTPKGQRPGSAAAP